MSTPRSVYPTVTWRFILGWLACILAGGLIGALSNQALSGSFLRGLSLGVVMGNLVAVGVFVWRNRGQVAPALPDLNIQLMGAVLVMTALGVVVYLAAGWGGVRFNWFFPQADERQ